MENVKNQPANEPTYRTFTAGQKVRSVFGEMLTVTEQRGCQVWVRENMDYYHPSKIFPVAAK